ncbi:MAG TPA: hypothetical protein VF657_22505 [Actinoplanes sp.]|jgi:hypothetical protein
MDVSAPEILLGFFAIMCAVGVAYGSRWISRRSDAVLESTRLALRSRHAVPEAQSTLLDDPAGRPEMSWAARLDADALAPDTPADVPTGVPAAPAAAPAVADDDLESTGRHRVPEELMRASTYLLSPDRIARARVPAPRFQNVPDPLSHDN